MSLELITIRELLRDPQYKAFFTKTPKLPDHYTPEMKPWKLLVQKENETHWRAKRFGTYREAFDGFKKMLPVITNAAINCPALTFMPPIRNVRVKGKFITVQGGHKRPYVRSIIWKPQISADMEQHFWCPHCRRPSIFKYASSSIRTNTGKLVTEPTLRCVICGASDRIIDIRHPEKAQRWDLNRPKIYNLSN